jgi:hypothetical protein
VDGWSCAQDAQASARCDRPMMCVENSVNPGRIDERDGTQVNHKILGMPFECDSKRVPEVGSRREVNLAFNTDRAGRSAPLDNAANSPGEVGCSASSHASPR